MTVRDDVDWLVPRLAGWYAGPDPWASLYGPPLRLVEDARRFSVSPAWFDVTACSAYKWLVLPPGRGVHDGAR